MSKPSLFALLLLALPLAAFAQLAPLPVSQCPLPPGVAEAIQSCGRQQAIDIAALNQQSLMLPTSMPVRIATTGGRMTMVPLIPTEAMPADAVMVPVSVPVKVYSTPTSSCLTTQLDKDLVNTVLMVPYTSGGQTVMQPCQLREQEDRLMILPLNMSAVNGPVNVPLYANGQPIMVPLDCRSTADGITFCPRTAQGQMNIWCK